MSDVDWKQISVLHSDAVNRFNQMQRLLQEATRLTFPGRNYFYQYSEDACNDKQQYDFDNK